MAVPKIWRKIPEQYNLVGKKCISCSNMIFPQRDVCSKCGSTDLSWHKFRGYGEIVTYTIIRTPLSDPEGEIPEKVARPLPYALAVIRLDEGPMLTAEIVDFHEDGIAIGKKVEMVFRKLVEKSRKGVIQYGYKFRISDD